MPRASSKERASGFFEAARARASRGAREQVLVDDGCGESRVEMVLAAPRLTPGY